MNWQQQQTRWTSLSIRFSIFFYFILTSSSYFVADENAQWLQAEISHLKKKIGEMLVFMPFSQRDDCMKMRIEKQKTVTTVIGFGRTPELFRCDGAFECWEKKIETVAQCLQRLHSSHHTFWKRIENASSDTDHNCIIITCRMLIVLMNKRRGGTDGVGVLTITML